MSWRDILKVERKAKFDRKNRRRRSLFKKQRHCLITLILMVMEMKTESMKEAAKDKKKKSKSKDIYSERLKCLGET